MWLIKNETSAFAKSKISPTAKLTNGALIAPASEMQRVFASLTMTATEKEVVWCIYCINSNVLTLFHCGLKVGNFTQGCIPYNHKIEIWKKGWSYFRGYTLATTCRQLIYSVILLSHWINQYINVLLYADIWKYMISVSDYRKQMLQIYLLSTHSQFLSERHL